MDFAPLDSQASFFPICTRTTTTEQSEQTVSVSRRVSDGEQIDFFLKLHPALTFTYTAHTMRLKYAGSRMHLYIFNC